MRSESALARQVRSPRVVNIADLRERARRRLPGLVFDYIDGAAEDEVTEARNRARLLRGDLPAPAVRAGPGVRSENDGARSGVGAAVSAGAGRATAGRSTRWATRTRRGRRTRPGRLSSSPRSRARVSRMSERRPPVRSGTSCTCREGAPSRKPTIARAKAAGYTALVVTIDTPVAGLRERDIRRRRSSDPRWATAGEPSVPVAVRGAAAVGAGLSCGRRAAAYSPTWSCQASVRCRAATSARCWSRRW